MNMKYEIVKYSPEFKSQVAELQKHLWGPDVALNAAYLEWKHEHNPYIDTPLLYLALYKGQVVGIRGTYGAQWQIGYPYQIFPGRCAGDLVVAPEHRDRGLFKKMTMAAVNDLADSDYTYVLPQSRLLEEMQARKRWIVRGIWGPQ